MSSNKASRMHAKAITDFVEKLEIARGKKKSIIKYTYH